MKDIIKNRENIRLRVLLFMYESTSNIVPFPFIEKEEIATGISDILFKTKNGEAEIDFAIEYLIDKGYIIRERRRSDGLPSHAFCLTANGIDIAEKLLKGDK